MKLKYVNNKVTKETEILIELVNDLNIHKKLAILKRNGISYEIKDRVYYFYNSNNELIKNGEHDFYTTISNFILKHELVEFFKLKKNITIYNKGEYGINIKPLTQEFKDYYNLDFEFLAQILRHDDIYVFLNNSDIKVIK